MADARTEYKTVSLPVTVTDYIAYAQSQIPGAEELSMSSIVKVICQWACSNPDYLAYCIGSAATEGAGRSRPKKKIGE